jgi:hypothetical protein
MERFKAKQLEYLLHGDLRAETVEVDTGHAVCSQLRGGLSTRRREEGPFRSHYPYRERGTVLEQACHVSSDA